MNWKFRSFVPVLWILVAACAKAPEKNAFEAAPSNAAAESPSTTADANQLAATLAELTQVVRKYGAEKQKVPKDLNELVVAGYLPGIPAAPAGKRFAINKQMEVYLADQ